MEKIQVAAVKKKKPAKKKSVEPFTMDTNGSRADPAFSGPVRILTNDSRTQYRKPEPKLMILKRPETQENKPTESPVSRCTNDPRGYLNISVCSNVLEISPTSLAYL